MATDTKHLTEESETQLAINALRGSVDGRIQTNGDFHEDDVRGDFWRIYLDPDHQDHTLDVDADEAGAITLTQVYRDDIVGSTLSPAEKIIQLNGKPYRTDIMITKKRVTIKHYIHCLETQQKICKTVPFQIKHPGFEGLFAIDSEFKEITDEAQILMQLQAIDELLKQRLLRSGDLKEVIEEVT